MSGETVTIRSATSDTERSLIDVMVMCMRITATCYSVFFVFIHS